MIFILCVSVFPDLRRWHTKLNFRFHDVYVYLKVFVISPIILNFGYYMCLVLIMCRCLLFLGKLEYSVFFENNCAEL